jgi:hypothetical protein
MRSLTLPVGVVALQLGPEAHADRGREPRQPDQRGVADGVGQVLVPHRASLPRQRPRGGCDHVAVGQLGVERAQEPDVLVVDVDVDEAVQGAVLVSSDPAIPG